MLVVPVYVLLPAPAAVSTTASTARSLSIVVQPPAPDPGHHAEIHFASVPAPTPAWLPVSKDYEIVSESVVVAVALVTFAAWLRRPRLRESVRGP